MKTKLLLSALKAFAATFNPMPLMHSVSKMPLRNMPKDAIPSNNNLQVINRTFTRLNNRKQRRARK
jgi:hypothetical protein